MLTFESVEDEFPRKMIVEPFTMAAKHVFNRLNGNSRIETLRALRHRENFKTLSVKWHKPWRIENGVQFMRCPSSGCLPCRGSETQMKSGTRHFINSQSELISAIAGMSSDIQSAIFVGIKISEDIVFALSKKGHLTHIFFDGCQLIFDPDVIPILSNIAGLYSLSFACSSLTDSIAKQVSKLSSLRVVNFTGAQVGGATLGAIAQLPDIKHVDMSFTDLSNEGIHDNPIPASVEYLNIGLSDVTPEGLRGVRWPGSLLACGISYVAKKKNEIMGIINAAPNVREIYASGCELSVDDLQSLNQYKQGVFVLC